MAWTSPRTWAVGENVTAAQLNTHVRDNFLQTATAKVTTAGDLVYANAANSLVRRAIGTPNKFLRGGATAPAWDDTLGDATNNGMFIVKGTDPKLRLSETDAADPDDYWETTVGASDLIQRFWDNSAVSNRIASVLTPKDVILHTGVYGQGAGSVVIESDESAGGVAATTGGATGVSVSITTGGPAFISGLWSARVVRVAAGAASDTVTFIPRDDGANLSTAFQQNTDWAENNIPGNGDAGIITGIWFKRVTSDDTSVWAIAVFASANSIFTYTMAMLVTSMQYPT